MKSLNITVTLKSAETVQYDILIPDYLFRTAKRIKNIKHPESLFHNLIIDLTTSFNPYELFGFSEQEPESSAFETKEEYDEAVGIYNDALRKFDSEHAVKEYGVQEFGFVYDDETGEFRTDQTGEECSGFHHSRIQNKS